MSIRRLNMSPKSLSVVARLTAAALAFLAVGAAPKRKSGPGIKAPKTCQTFRVLPAGPANAVEVTFLGVSGFLIRWAGQSIMTPPLYSNPTMGEVALSELYADGERIDRLLYYKLNDLTAIIVGHSHYDHAMDVPYIALRKASQAWIYGSQTLVNILDPLKRASITLRNAEERALCKVVDPFVDPCPTDATPCTGTHSFDIPEVPTPEVPTPRFRIWPIVSEHSAPFGPKLVASTKWPLGKLFTLLVRIDPVVGWRGQLLAPAKTIPTRAGDWTGGTVLSYVIELLDSSEKPVFRIYYQDSPTRKPIGYPPACLVNNKKPIDLALLCVGGATEKPIAGQFPKDIVEAIKPQYVIGEHWEDLFNPRALPLPGEKDVLEKIRPAPGAHPKHFIRDVHHALPPGGRVTVPCWEDVAYFIRGGAGGWILDPEKTVGSWSDPK
jgi:hypothetical protein